MSAISGSAGFEPGIQGRAGVDPMANECDLRLRERIGVLRHRAVFNQRDEVRLGALPRDKLGARFAAAHQRGERLDAEATLGRLRVVASQAALRQNRRDLLRERFQLAQRNQRFLGRDLARDGLGVELREGLSRPGGVALDGRRVISQWL